MRNFCAQDLIALFDQTFYADFKTRLVHSSADPEYLPATDTVPYHRIAFAHGFFASALHEIAHWCIAGTERRQLVDFGYWYAPDGRNAAQQQAFYQVEVKPQALEWIFSVAAGKPFRVSTDNLNGEPADDEQFARDVYAQVLTYLQHSMPSRALRWATMLDQFYGMKNAFLSAEAYQLPEAAQCA